MEAVLLLILFTSVFLYFTKKLWKANVLAFFYICSLYLYSIPGLISYYFFPGINNPKTNFGVKYWYGYYLFILFSFVCYGMMSLFFSRKRSFLCFSIKLDKNIKKYFPIITVIVICLITLFQVYVMIRYRSILSWENIANESFMKSHRIIWINNIIFKISIGNNIVLWGIIRGKAQNKKLNNSLTIIFLVNLLVATSYATFTGNRTDLVATFLGLLMIEVSYGYFCKKNIFKYFLAFIVAVVGMVLIERARGSLSPNGSEYGFLVRLLGKDYNGPIQMFFTAVRFEYINPLEVVKSNVCNSLVRMNYPYLQYGLTEMIDPGVATRSAGYAFYSMTEGFLFMGYWGILYNGFVFAFWIYIWWKIASTNDKEYNTVVLGCMGAQMINLVRGQTSYFIKYFYLGIIFQIVLYVFLTGKRPALRVKMKK